MKFQRNVTIALFLWTALGAGCAPSRPAPEALPLTEAHQRLITLCRDEFKAAVKIFPLSHTVYVYLPLENSFLDIKATEKKPVTADTPSVRQAIRYLDVSSRENAFHVVYDIGVMKSYPQDLGYASAFSEEYLEQQRNVLTAIHRVYADAADPPDFFVVVITDTVKGLESRTIINSGDLRRAFTDQFFQEEYVKRVMVENPVGNKEIIGDKEGKYLTLKELTWPDFLARQIAYRIRFLYERSSFPPSEDTLKELTLIIKETIDAYQYAQFEAAHLHNLENDKVLIIPRGEL